MFVFDKLKYAFIGLAVMCEGLVPICVLAASETPSIGSISGSFGQDDTVAIGGAGFEDGTDSNGYQDFEVFIDFDDCPADGESIDGISGLSSYLQGGGPLTACDDGRSFSGSYSAFLNGDDGVNCPTYFELSGDSHTDLYVSYMVYPVGLTGASNCTYKGIRFVSRDTTIDYPIHGYPFVVQQNAINPSGCTNANGRLTINPNNASGDDWNLYPGAHNLDTWNHIEMRATASSTAGIVSYWRDLALKDERSGADQTPQGTHRFDGWDGVLLPFYVGNGLTAQVWFDDVFISTSRAKVMLGDAASYSECTKREPQPLISWSNISINFALHHGSFGPGDFAWIYVMDSEGNVNSVGERIGPLGLQDNISPSRPTNLRILP